MEILCPPAGAYKQTYAAVIAARSPKRRIGVQLAAENGAAKGKERALRRVGRVWARARPTSGKTGCPRREVLEVGQVVMAGRGWGQ